VSSSLLGISGIAAFRYRSYRWLWRSEHTFLLQGFTRPRHYERARLEVRCEPPHTRDAH